MNSECQGCESYMNGRCTIGIIQSVSDTEVCPCSICLVKSMCNGRVCDAFAKYAKKCVNLNPILYRLRKKGLKWDWSAEKRYFVVGKT